MLPEREDQIATASEPFFEQKGPQLPRPSLNDEDTESSRAFEEQTNLMDGLQNLPPQMQQLIVAGRQAQENQLLQGYAQNQQPFSMVNQQQAMVEYGEKEIQYVPSSLLAGICYFIGLIAVLLFVETACPLFGSSCPGFMSSFAYVAIFVIVMFFSGFKKIEPQTAVTITFLGLYKGTIKNFVGPCFVNPFYKATKISLQYHTEETQIIKVNDKFGNPIMIQASYIWTVHDTYKASFVVSDYKKFIDVMAEPALRKLAMTYNYDTMNDGDDEKFTLRSGSTEIQALLLKELNKAVEFCGAKVIEARITQLQYAPEIRAVMLRRQQAQAVVAARFPIVEGAISIVELALAQLKTKGIELNDNQKANVVHKLMMVLCKENNRRKIEAYGEDGANRLLALLKKHMVI